MRIHEDKGERKQDGLKKSKSNSTSFFTSKLLEELGDNIIHLDFSVKIVIWPEAVSFFIQTFLLSLSI